LNIPRILNGSRAIRYAMSTDEISGKLRNMGIAFEEEGFLREILF